MNLPTRLRDSRKLIETLDLQKIEAAVAQEARAQLVIIGPVNSGKSTLFNQLKGQKLSDKSPVPGTTVEPLYERFGPFWLVDTPGMGEAAGHVRAAAAIGALDQADVAILVLDAGAGLRQNDVELYHDVRALGVPCVVVLNKIDLVKKDEEAVVRDAEWKIGGPIIPISAKKGTNIASDLIPALIDSHPRMAVTIGRYLPKFRSRAAQRIIHGQQMTAARARELLSAIAGGVVIRYGAQELAKLIPGPGWLVAGAVAGTGTVALGNTAQAFFSYSLSPQQLRKFYRRVRWRLNIGKKKDGTTKDVLV